MKEQVFEVIKQYGENGIRLRDIGYYCGVWHVSCLVYVTELMNEGKIHSKTIGSGWQAYIEYYVTDS